LIEQQVERFVARHWRIDSNDVEVHLQRLPGGLESNVALARVSTKTRQDVPARLVVKELRGEGTREANIYSALRQHVHDPPSPHVFGEQTLGGRRYVYMESVPARTWPWTQAHCAIAVCQELAKFHTARSVPLEPFAWDYEELLATSAAETLDLARRLRDATGSRYWTRLGDLHRVVDALPMLRNELLSQEAVVIHGDVHPGNVMMRETATHPRITFIDWGRARVGSPMEDVASWLQSLGCWEPEARRRHDTLLRAYFAGRHVNWPPSPAMRRAYWFAAASNGLSGAIRFHLAVLADHARDQTARHHSRVALHSLTRMVRRVAALLSTSQRRRL
jgi:aminoglycoside phosphotransferase (APT) family kinase protein